LARSGITVAAVDSMTNYVYKFLERLDVVGTVNSIYPLARTKPSCSRRQASDVVTYGRENLLCPERHCSVVSSLRLWGEPPVHFSAIYAHSVSF